MRDLVNELRSLARGYSAEGFRGASKAPEIEVEKSVKIEPEGEGETCPHCGQKMATQSMEMADESGTGIEPEAAAEEAMPPEAAAGDGSGVDPASAELSPEDEEALLAMA